MTDRAELSHRVKLLAADCRRLRAELAEIRAMLRPRVDPGSVVVDSERHLPGEELRARLKGLRDLLNDNGEG